MKVVKSYLKADDAYLAASVLEGSGLSPSIRDGHTIGVDWFYSQAIGGVKLEVPDSEYERAVELLDLPAMVETVFTCPCCGSSNVKPRQLSLLNALSLLVFWIALPVVSRRADCIDCKAVLKMKETSEGLELY